MCTCTCMWCHKCIHIVHVDACTHQTHYVHHLTIVYSIEKQRRWPKEREEVSMHITFHRKTLWDGVEPVADPGFVERGWGGWLAMTISILRLTYIYSILLLPMWLVKLSKLKKIALLWTAIMVFLCHLHSIDVAGEEPHPPPRINPCWGGWAPESPEHSTPSSIHNTPHMCHYVKHYCLIQTTWPRLSILGSKYGTWELCPKATRTEPSTTTREL